MFPKDYQTYVNELAETLRARDLARVKEFYLRWKEKMELRPLPPDELLEAQMHQMICEFPSLSDLQAESRRWLLEHGSPVPVEVVRPEPKTE